MKKEYLKLEEKRENRLFSNFLIINIILIILK